MNIRQQTATPYVMISVTGTAPQELLPPLTGYQYVITQLGAHERNGNIRDTIWKFGNDEYFRFTIGMSGSVIWDMANSQDLPIGSGLYGQLNFPGAVDYIVRYAVRDVREPTNLNPLTYVHRTIRKPNNFGSQ